jgi:class 3 adenylate cyclase
LNQAVESRLPAGTVTFLFTDIEGSTRLLQKLGDEYADLLAEHRRALREAFVRHGGVEMDTQGDAFFVAFAKAADALAAASAACEALAGGPIRVRIGLHTGEPTRTDEGTSGSTCIVPRASPLPVRRPDSPLADDARSRRRGSLARPRFAPAQRPCSA